MLLILCVIVNAAWCFCRRFSLCKQPYRKFVYMFVILAATTCLCSSLCPVLRDEHTSCRVWVWVWVWVWLRVCVCVCVLPWQETAHKKPRLSTAEAWGLCVLYGAPSCILLGRPERQCAAMRRRRMMNNGASGGRLVWWGCQSLPAKSRLPGQRAMRGRRRDHA